MKYLKTKPASILLLSDLMWALNEKHSIKSAARFFNTNEDSLRKHVRNNHPELYVEFTKNSTYRQATHNKPQSRL